MSGLDLPDGTQIRKGAGNSVIAWVEEDRRLASTEHDELQTSIDEISNARRHAPGRRDQDGDRRRLGSSVSST